MPRTVVVADSSACLPPEILAELGIIIVPLTFLLDGELRRDGELSGPEFYKRLRDSRGSPLTNAPAPGEFLEAFRKARHAGATSVLCLTLSALFSGTQSSAKNAAEMAAHELPGLDVHVTDTGGVAMVHGFAVLAAARAVRAGATLEEAAAAARDVGGRAHLVGALDTTRYLARGGRVPWILHWAASALQIKPILATSGGKVAGVGRARTMNRAVHRMLDYAAARIRPQAPLHAAVMHADSPERAAALARLVEARFQPAELMVTEFTSVMGIHTGPGFVGLAFYSGQPAPETAAPFASEDPALERDVRTLEGALGPLPRPQARPPLVVLSGLPGSGKSHLARELCRRYPLARLDSDALRRALERRPDYSAAESSRLFAACHALLGRLLARGVPSILDATNLKEVHRRPLYRLAETHGARLVLVLVEAPPETVRRRLEGRMRGENPWDRSEAGPEVYAKMEDEAEPIERPHIVVDTSKDIRPAVDMILRELREVTV